MMSGFLLSILSPVWRAKICSVFRFADKRLDLTSEDASSFLTVVKLGCGQSVMVQGGLAGLLDVGRLADMYRIEHVHRAAEWKAKQWLAVNTCGELLASSRMAGMHRLESSCRALALDKFEAVARTEGFLRLDQDQLSSLLDDTALKATREEAVFEAVVRWMSVREAGGGRGKELLARIRFPLMQSSSLAGPVWDMAPRMDGLQELVDEALAVQAGRGSAGLQFLGSNASVPRRVAASEPRPWRLHGLSQKIFYPGEVKCFAATERYVYVGTCISGILATDRISQFWPNIEFMDWKNRVLICSITLWRGWLVIAARLNNTPRIEVWQQSPGKYFGVTWKCIGLMEEHSMLVDLLSTCGDDAWLVSAVTWRVTIKVWTTGDTAGTWVCKHTIQAPDCTCVAVSASATSIACGERLGNIRVWDATSGSCHTTLQGHAARVQAVWVDSDGLRLISASEDGTIKVWDMYARACVATLELGEGGGTKCMSVSDGSLFCGVKSTVVRGDKGSVVAVRVWDLGTLEEAESIRVRTRGCIGESVEVKQLLVDQGQVWARINDSLVMWGVAGRMLPMSHPVECVLLAVMFSPLAFLVWFLVCVVKFI